MPSSTSSDALEAGLKSAQALERRPTAKEARDAHALLTSAGFALEPDDFFIVQVTQNGTEVSPDGLPDHLREALELVRDHIDATEVDDVDWTADALSEEARRQGATPDQVDALVNVHEQLQGRDMPGFDDADISELLTADSNASGYIDDLEARIGVDVDALRRAVFPDTPTVRPG